MSDSEASMQSIELDAMVISDESNTVFIDGRPMIKFNNDGNEGNS